MIVYTCLYQPRRPNCVAFTVGEWRMNSEWLGWLRVHGSHSVKFMNHDLNQRKWITTMNHIIIFHHPQLWTPWDGPETLPMGSAPARCPRPSARYWARAVCHPGWAWRPRWVALRHQWPTGSSSQGGLGWLVGWLVGMAGWLMVGGHAFSNNNRNIFGYTNYNWLVWNWWELVGVGQWSMIPFNSGRYYIMMALKRLKHDGASSSWSMIHDDQQPPTSTNNGGLQLCTKNDWA